MVKRKHADVVTNTEYIMAHTPVASESNSAAKKINDAQNGVIGWAVGVITTIALLLGVYAVSGVSGLEIKTAVNKQNIETLGASINEIKATQKDMSREQVQMSRQLDRIGDAVGAKKP